jgi:hypothetical protein
LRKVARTCITAVSGASPSTFVGRGGAQADQQCMKSQDPCVQRASVCSSSPCQHAIAQVAADVRPSPPPRLGCHVRSSLQHPVLSPHSLARATAGGAVRPARAQPRQRSPGRPAAALAQLPAHPPGARPRGVSPQNTRPRPSHGRGPPRAAIAAGSRQRRRGRRSLQIAEAVQREAAGGQRIPADAGILATRRAGRQAAAGRTPRAAPRRRRPNATAGQR